MIQYEGIEWEPVWITRKSTSNPRKFRLLGTPVEEAGMINNSEPCGHMGCKKLLSFVITLPLYRVDRCFLQSAPHTILFLTMRTRAYPDCL